MPTVPSLRKNPLFYRRPDCRPAWENRDASDPQSTGRASCGLCNIYNNICIILCIFILCDNEVAHVTGKGRKQLLKKEYFAVRGAVLQRFFESVSHFCHIGTHSVPVGRGQREGNGGIYFFRAKFWFWCIIMTH